MFFVKIGGNHVPPPSPRPVAFRANLLLAKAALDALAPVSGYQPITADSVVAQYSGPKRQRYAKAKVQFEREGVKRKDAVVKGFLKFEKIESNNPNKPWASKVCRFIGPLSFVYNVALGRYLLPMEKKCSVVSISCSVDIENIE